MNILRNLLVVPAFCCYSAFALAQSDSTDANTTAPAAQSQTPTESQAAQDSATVESTQPTPTTTANTPASAPASTPVSATSTGTTSASPNTAADKSTSNCVCKEGEFTGFKPGAEVSAYAPKVPCRCERKNSTTPAATTVPVSPPSTTAVPALPAPAPTH